MNGTTNSPDVAHWLERAAAWRFASMLFQSPTAEIASDLRSVVAEVPAEWRAGAEPLVGCPLDEWEAEYHRVLGPAGCPASESSYDDNALAGRGPLLSRVAGFYEAFAYRPDEVSPEVPDHLSHELGFLSYMALKIAFALHADEPAAAGVARDAYRRFRNEHLLTWLDRFEQRLRGTESAFYAAAIGWVRTLIPRSA